MTSLCIPLSLSAKRQRKESKYLSPPYVDSTLRVFKEGKGSCAKSKKSHEGVQKKKSSEAAAEEEEEEEEEEDAEMIMTVSDLKAAAAAASSDKKANNRNAVSELKAIRKKLEISSFILREYHKKFKRDEKDCLLEDIKSFGEQAEAVRKRIRALAENTPIS